MDAQVRLLFLISKLITVQLKYSFQFILLIIRTIALKSYQCVQNTHLTDNQSRELVTVIQQY